MTATSQLAIASARSTRDLASIVDVHAEAFPDHFLTRMGLRFLKHYYSTLLDFPRAIALVASVEDRVAGFAVGFARPKEFYAALRSRRWQALPLVLAASLRTPSLIPQIAANVRRVRADGGGDTEVELSSIAVRPTMASGGIGGILLTRFIDAARQLHCTSVYLTTDTVDNQPILDFYIKRGFAIEAAPLRGKRPMSRLRFAIRPETPVA